MIIRAALPSIVFDNDFGAKDKIAVHIHSSAQRDTNSASAGASVICNARVDVIRNRDIGTASG
jgi:hypothetical protein